MYNLFDVVKTKKALSDADSGSLERGSTGTILEVYKRGTEIGYNVEFMDSSGNTTAVLIVDDADLEPLEVTPGDKVANVVAFARRKKPPTPANTSLVMPYRPLSDAKVAAKAAGARAAKKSVPKTAARAAKKAASPKPKKPTHRRTK